MSRGLLFLISEIDELFLEEAETASFEPGKITGKRVAKYGAIAAAAAVGLAVTYRIISVRGRRVRAQSA